MEMHTIASCLRQIESEFQVIAADTDDILHRIHELRYQVYCTERGFLPGANGLESDEFDHRSRHLALIMRRTGELIGTARLVLPSPDQGAADFPMQAVCDPALFDHLPRSTSAEVSRFAISKQRRDSGSLGLARLALVKGLVHLSAALGVTHWCAVMEPTLLRLLRMTSIHFHPLGPLIEYHGPRQPCFNRLDHLLDTILRERPPLWRYLTRGSAFWRDDADQAIAA
jgi:N-acyl-L-homoserine lactone synthetase